MELLVFLVEQFSIWFQGNSQIAKFCACPIDSVAPRYQPPPPPPGPLKNPGSTPALDNRSIVKPLLWALKLGDCYIDRDVNVVLIVLNPCSVEDNSVKKLKGLGHAILGNFV